MPASAGRTGYLMIIGGAEDKLRQRQILSRFLSLAGGSNARIAVIATASSLGEEAGELYDTVFRAMGAPEVRRLRPLTRAEADDRRTAALLDEVTGVFMTGGNQLRLASVMAGTRLARALARRDRAGAVVAGTSAGASAIGSEMVAFGTGGATPKQRMTQMSAGLGLLPGVLIDQHFEQRNRIGRLLALTAQSPALLGIGLDEDTAGVVGPNGGMEVIGKGAITIIDATHVVTDAPDVKRHRPIMVSGVILHSLPSGYRFDLRRRRLLPPLRSLAATERDQEILRHAGERTRQLVRRIAAEGADDTAPERAMKRAMRRHREEASE
jgi:cyanophycinase